MIPNAWQGFDFGLGEDVDQLRDTARSFSQDRIAPRADEIDRTNQFPRDLWPELGKVGLLGVTVEEEYGGAGMGYLAHMVAMEEISRASASAAGRGARMSSGAQRATACGAERPLMTPEARAAALAAITASVVGVVGNLAVWFALKVVFKASAPWAWGPMGFDMPVLSSLDPAAAAMAALAAVALFRLKWGVIQTLSLAAAAGIAARLLGA